MKMQKAMQNVEIDMVSIGGHPRSSAT